MVVTSAPVQRVSQVLVVEDDIAIQDVVARALREEGLLVRTAIAVRDAERMATDDCPGLVVLDWMLPDGDGHDMARAIRLRCPEVPILLVTAASAAAEKARQINAIGYLRKPFDLNQLIDTVLAALPA